MNKNPGGDRNMRLVLVGPPGSGKGTQAKLLVERLSLRYIGTGEILREAIRLGTPTGKLAKPFIDRGDLVSDNLVNELIAEVFQLGNRPDNFVLDGYPRTIAQAIWFDHFLANINIQLNGVIRFLVDDEEVVQRISGRWVCPQCKKNYHQIVRPPKVSQICDDCKTPLAQRADDREETIRARLRVFHQSADLLIDHYRKIGLLFEIPTNQPVEVIYQSIVDQLKVKQ